VEVLDFVEDLGELIRDSRVVVAPAFSGGGTRIKLLTALAHGVPVVTNLRGGQGLPAGPEGGVLRAESATEIAELTARCLREPDLELGAAAREAHLRDNAPAAAADAQLEVLRDALDDDRRRFPHAGA
jgi:glycosyltransferase involved in cell wall biosynthesis